MGLLTALVMTPMLALSWGMGLGFLAGIALVALASASADPLVLEQAHRTRTRAGESICDFARSFERRTVDTWVVRAAYERITAEVGYSIRAEDSLSSPEEPFWIPEVFVEPIANRCGRSLEVNPTNPGWGRVETVGDLVRFLSAQPRVTRP